MDDAQSKPTNGAAAAQNIDKPAEAAGHDDSDDDNENDNDAEGAGEGAAKKKKKRKPRKKKKAGAGGAKTQTSPPSVPLSDLYPNNVYPEGELEEYRDENSFRTTSEEKRHLDRMNNDFLNEYRKGAEIHRQVRQWAQNWIKPGMGLTEIAEGIEDSVRRLTGHMGLEPGDAQIAGMGFPTGLSINHCAAHYTPNAGNKMVVNYEDVMKVDFGVHINGRIVDSAFTMTFDPVYDNLVEACKAATNAGVKEAGIDVRMSDIGAAIQEVMESYEVEIKGEMTGHNRKAVAIEFQHRLAHAIEVRPLRQVFDARDGRLRAQRRPRDRRPVQRHLEGGIVPQHVAIVAIRIAGHDRQHAKPQDFIKGMRDLAGLPRIVQASRQAVRQIQPPFDVLEQQDTTIGRGAPSVDHDRNRLVTNR